jgi:hypothetical protein
LLKISSIFKNQMNVLLFMFSIFLHKKSHIFVKYFHIFVLFLDIFVLNIHIFTTLLYIFTIFFHIFVLRTNILPFWILFWSIFALDFCYFRKKNRYFYSIFLKMKCIFLLLYWLFLFNFISFWRLYKQNQSEHLKVMISQYVSNTAWVHTIRKVNCYHQKKFGALYCLYINKHIDFYM